ncbi:MAG: hypothetical protein AAF447_14245 [Myxococcota bacterium]
MQNHVLAGALLVAILPSLAGAQPVSTAASGESSGRHALDVHLVGTGDDGVLGLGYRYGLAGGSQLGLSLRTGYARTLFSAGQALEDATMLQTVLHARVPVLREGRLVVAFRGDLGLRSYFGPDGFEGDEFAPATQREASAVHVLDVEAGLVASVSAGTRGLWRLGVLATYGTELTPGSEVDRQGALLVSGGSLDVGRRAQLFADLELGGVFGAGGDAAKVLYRSTLGVRVRLGAGSADAAPWRSF